MHYPLWHSCLEFLLYYVLPDTEHGIYIIGAWVLNISSAELNDFNWRGTWSVGEAWQSVEAIGQETQIRMN